MQLGSTPWHLWGQVVQQSYVGSGITTIAPQLVANVDYGRPETWKPFLLIGVQSNPGATFGGAQNFGIDLNIGVGRSNIHMRRFWTVQFSEAQLESGNYHSQWTTRPLGPPNTQRILDSAAALNPSAEVNPVDFFPAQTIQAQFELSLLFSGTLNLTIAAFFAPIHHARPDWFVEKFTGELNGR